ncbi:MAG TPA: hypothetical protein PKC43_11460 [Phycisphaerales bacterium]|nr:hypothetical protein [Phycisphaerales bacterium]HMP38049.1 hypothetical protein [Phycisphaerales bacterium]
MTALAPTEADRNRERVQELEGEVRTLRGRVGELEAALGLSERLSASAAIDPAVLAAAPFAESIRLGRFGGFEDRDGDGAADLLRLSIEALDGGGRPVQVAGWARVELTCAPLGGAPRRIATLELEPAELRERFRSGLFGASYSIELPVAAAHRPEGPCILVVELRDGITGRTMRTEETVDPAQVLSRPIAPSQRDSVLR